MLGRVVADPRPKFGRVGTSVDLHAMFEDGSFVKSARVFCQRMILVCRGTPSGG